MVKKVKETKAHRIYGPYVDEKSGNIAWWVIPAHGERKVFTSKTEMLKFVDAITASTTKKLRK